MRRVKVWVACAVFATVYGAVCGAVFGYLQYPSPPYSYGILPVRIGMIVGGVFGLFGGVVTGVVGSILRDRWGWGIAGTLGGLAATLMAVGWSFGLEAILEVWFYALVVAAIGGTLGLAVGCCVRSGKSYVPGVQKLASVINDSTSPRTNAFAAEVTPARTLIGRGDETMPAQQQVPP